MAKLGRNDPCPCGSGKKHKNCCLSVPKGDSARVGLPEMLKDERQKAEQIARRWLGQDEDESTPLRDGKGRRLLLVLDRYQFADVETVRQVRLLGRSDGERVLFFDGPQWIAEADFSVPGQMLMVTPGTEQADRLKALMAPIPGLLHQQRQIDDLSALDHVPSGGGGAGLLDFKKTFFAAWLDEPNQKLDDATPRQAALSKDLRPKLHRLLADLEAKEARLPKSERFSFGALRQQLGIS